MFETCIRKQNKIFVEFSNLSKEAKYKKIIQLGQELPAIDASKKIERNLVKGCQSRLYLVSFEKDGKLYFEADADALISEGLAALLLYVYSGESPEAILKCPPDFLAEIGIHESLTPSRSNGLASLHLRMKQDALEMLVAKK